MVDAAKIKELRELLEDRRGALSDPNRWPTYEHEVAQSLALDRLCIAVVDALPGLLDLAARARTVVETPACSKEPTP